MSHVNDHFSEDRIRSIIREYLEQEYVPGQRALPRGRGYEALLDDLAIRVEELFNANYSLDDAITKILRAEDLYTDSWTRTQLKAKLNRQGIKEFTLKDFMRLL